MKLTINIPDIIPNDKVLKLILQIEELFEKENIICKVKHDIPVKNDPWFNLDLNETGIEDLS